MTFLQTLTQVLCGEPVIKSLPDDGLIAVNKGTPMDVGLPIETLHKLSRLQTLIFQEIKKGEMSEVSEFEGLERIRGTAQGNSIVDRANALMVQADSVERVEMLERLFIEIVRESIPRECEHFDVRYCVNSDLQVCWDPMPQIRHMD